ncbi:MCP four helix bundle domain-containing protein [Curvibacter sp. CHRR-16]|uniref:methyl-accepting chemotaxis protein n=1 Tax=Curvibacter sp. CHRR-16 TaxID=2835872 RepID=UPI001BDA8F3B|nr:methyl-accepting chemotaxis protein [Curvibacter sp. CHRR-16]MBT0571758.1 MCP four helix bundle domain-containing protein [Curvibacter sp. CHRR-16]
MDWIRSITIRTRLFVCFGIIVILMLISSVFSYAGLNKSNSNVKELATDWLASVKAVSEVMDKLNVARRVEQRIILESATDKKEVQIKRFQDNIELVNKAIQNYEPLVSSPEEKEQFDAIKSNWQAYLELTKQTIPLSAKDDSNLAEARDKNIYQTGPKLLAAIAAANKAVDLNMKGGEHAFGESQTTFSTTVSVMLLLAFIAMAGAAVLGIVVTRSITAPIEEALAIAGYVAEGNLRTQKASNGKDEIATLLNDLRRMRHTLRSVVEAVRQNSEQILTGSSEIAMGNHDLSVRTEHQAANVQQTSSAMQQMNNLVQHSAETARTATQVAASVSAAAQQGGQAMERVVGTMQEIAQSSHRIVEIISVIDGIAFQTNILALNAAVEAARAGEQGRGFAVVASEVRSLAQRSADAAKEIKTLITNSTEKVDAGNQHVAAAGESVRDIVQQVKRVSDLINEMGSATAEQTTGISQVASSVSQLDQATQQNAALVEEMAAAATSLKTQAESLVSAVDVFKLNPSTGVVPAASSTHHASPVQRTSTSTKPKIHSKASNLTSKPQPSVAASTPAKAQASHTPTASKATDDEWETF